MSTDQPFRNESTQAERLRVLLQDTSAREATTFSRIAELDPKPGGRFSATQNVIRGGPDYPRQPAYWANADSNVEMPLGVSVDDVPDMVSVDGSPRSAPTPIEGSATPPSFKRRL
jgi:hypothetical protein